MPKITQPKSPDHYPNRDIDCQEAVERAFQNVMEDVIAAGWGPAEVAHAIETLATCDHVGREDHVAIDPSISSNAFGST